MSRDAVAAIGGMVGALTVVFSPAYLRSQIKVSEYISQCATRSLDKRAL